MRCHIQARGRETGARDGTRANPGRHGSGRWAHLAFNQLAFLGQFATSPSLEHNYVRASGQAVVTCVRSLRGLLASVGHVGMP